VKDPHGEFRVFYVNHAGDFYLGGGNHLYVHAFFRERLEHEGRDSGVAPHAGAYNRYLRYVGVAYHVTRLDSLPLGIVVNKHGDRFYDEGEDAWPKRYAIWGRLIARQPDQIAFSIVDAKVVGTFMPSVFPPVAASSIRELAMALGLAADRLEETVAAFNRAVLPGSFDHTTLDDCRTEGVVPSKSHWAQRLDTPPFWGYPLRPGITFTYLGVKVDASARVLMANGEPARNIYAAGEIMAGNILGKGYLAGFGMTIGTVFGRIAGQEAAIHARR